MVAEEPQSPPAGFPFNELIEDCVYLILTNYLDLPTLLSYGYTSKAAVYQVRRVVGKMLDPWFQFDYKFFPKIAKHGYEELLRFFIVETPPFGRVSDEWHMIDLISQVVRRGHVELLRRLMTIRDGVFVGFFCGKRMRLKRSCFHRLAIIQEALVGSNSPDMYGLFAEVKVPLDVISFCKFCIDDREVKLLMHVLKQMDARTALDIMCQVPHMTVALGAMDMMEVFMNELKMIRVEGNAFVVSYGGQNRVVPFQVAWLEKNLLEVVTWLERHEIQIAFSLCIGFHLLNNCDSGFLEYLEKKGIDYRDLVGENDFAQLFNGRFAHISYRNHDTFYPKVFRDRRILEKLTSLMTKHLISFIGYNENRDPEMFLPLVRSIYDISPWSHTLPHPFELMVQSQTYPTREMVHFLMDFSWTTQIDSNSFFKKVLELQNVRTSFYREIISEFIAMKKRNDSDLHFNVNILHHLIFAERMSLKDIHEILLVMPPLRGVVSFDSLSSFFDMRCHSGREIGSFVAIVKWLKSHLGEEMPAWSDAVAMKYITKSHDEVLPCLFDLGLPMPSKSSLAVLCEIKVIEPGKVTYRTERTIRVEVMSLRRTLEKLRVLKQRGADFPDSLLCDAFDFTSKQDVESAVGLASLFRHSEEVKAIFNFLIDECGCPLHANVLLAAIKTVGEESICSVGTKRTLEYLINRQCPSSDACMIAAISCDQSHRDSIRANLLNSSGRAVRRSVRLMSKRK